MEHNRLGAHNSNHSDLSFYFTLLVTKEGTRTEKRLPAAEPATKCLPRAKPTRPFWRGSNLSLFPSICSRWVAKRDVFSLIAGMPEAAPKMWERDTYSP